MSGEILYFGGIATWMAILLNEVHENKTMTVIENKKALIILFAIFTK
jgi:hypothetical protein